MLTNKPKFSVGSNNNKWFISCMHHIKAASQFKLCSWLSSNLPLMTFHSGHQDKRAAPLHNMLLVSGSICLDATHILLTHMLPDNADYKVSHASGTYKGALQVMWQRTQMCIPPVGVGGKCRAMNNVIIYHRTIQAEDMWIIIKIFSAGCNFKHQYLQLKPHWDMALSCLHIIKKI